MTVFRVWGLVFIEFLSILGFKVEDFQFCEIRV